MPSKQLQTPQPERSNPEVAGQEYDRLLAFLEISTGFNLAIAIGNSIALRRIIIADARRDIERFGVRVELIELKEDSSLDFAATIRKQIERDTQNGRLSIVVTGIDRYLYREEDIQAQSPTHRPVSVSAINFDREKIASELPFPLILWVESETARVLLRQAPDLAQWISARFDFTGLEGPFSAFSDVTNDLGQSAERTFGDIAELEALQNQLKNLSRSENSLTAHTRFLTLNSLGERYLAISNFPAALNAWSQAIELAQKLNEPRLAIGPMVNLGTAVHAMGDFKSAIEAHRRAVELAEAIGDKRAEGLAFDNLGVAYRSIADYSQAISSIERSIELARETGSLREVGKGLGNLGTVYNVQGRTKDAIDSYQKALEIARQTNDKRSEANSLGNLGNSFAALGKYDQAIKQFELAKGIAEQMGDRWREGSSLGNLGNVYNSLGEYRRAITYHERFLKIAREIGDKKGEGSALGNLGNSYQRLGDFDQAIRLHQENIRIAGEIGDVRSEANARWNLAQDYHLLGRLYEAKATATHAVELFERTNSPYLQTARTILSAWNNDGLQQSILEST